MRTLVLATQNEKKRKELEELSAGAFLVRTLADVGLGDLEIDEPGATFRDNAQIKADVVAGLLPEGVSRETFAVIADDSGLEVDILDGRPGVRSARFAKDHGVGEGDAANNKLLLTLLGAVPDEMRGARFVSSLCCVLVGTGERLFVDGAVLGRVAWDEAGGGGFGYDPLFVVEDAGAPASSRGKRMAELSAGEKHAISHRGRAMRALFDELRARFPEAQPATAAPFVFKRARPR